MKIKPAANTAGWFRRKGKKGGKKGSDEPELPVSDVADSVKSGLERDSMAGDLEEGGVGKVGASSVVFATMSSCSASFLDDRHKGGVVKRQLDNKARTGNRGQPMLDAGANYSGHN